MGLFSIFKKDISNPTYEGFSKWVDKHLENDLPPTVIAINFNLYEGRQKTNEGYKSTYDVQIVGSDVFDEEDDDWCCTDLFTTGEDIFYIDRANHISEWQQGLEFAKQMVQTYLQKGKYAEKLKSYQGIGIGFVDGDIEILYKTQPK